MSALVLILGLLTTLYLDFTAAQIGVVYGTNGDNLPSPAQVVELYKQYGIQRMRIYEPREETLQALRGTNIELTMSVMNPDLDDIAANQAAADAWVQKYVSNYPDVRFRRIVIGNEISPSSTNSQFALGAMQNIHTALSTAGKGDQIKVTTSIGSGALLKSDPPEDGEFKPDYAQYLGPIIQFLSSNGDPVLASIYPYLAYISDPQKIDLPYALLDPSYPGVTTPYGHTYQNLFVAMCDAVTAAIGRVVPEILDSGPGHVSGGETGLPTGGGDRISADADSVETSDNARMYINNLVQVVKGGTPLRPDGPIETYIFSMFDENQKRENEKHFGIFTPDGQPKFPVNFG